MPRIFTRLLLLLILYCLRRAPISAQRPAFGGCPDRPTLADFDQEKFEGLWYEVERSFYVFELIAHCSTFNFSLQRDGSYDVLFSMKNRVTNNMSSFKGKAVPNAANAAILDYRIQLTRIPGSVSRILPGSGKYHILATDYFNYAVMWSCSNLGIMHSDIVWVLSRKTDLDPDHRLEVYEILHHLKIDQESLTITKQENCPPSTK